MENKKMPLPREVKALIQRLEQHGYTAYVVGGAVRDFVMGKTPHDHDICTSALPEEMKAVFADKTVIETGLRHGTLTVVGREGQYEITTYRIDGEYEDSRHPRMVRFVDRIEDDLARRDFTVNAMAYNERTGLVDPFGGCEDVKNRIIRCVGDPEKRLTEDALRILRGVRFAVKCGFLIEKNTEKAMFLHKDLLKNVSAERQNAEFSRLLPTIALPELLRYKDIFAVFIPELIPMFGFDQRNFHHAYDVFEHSMRAVASAPEDLIIRLALFFHDIGKPSVFTVDENGVGHFYDHAKVGAEMTERILRRLKYDNSTVREVTELVEAHGLVPHESPRFARRLLAKYGEKQTARLMEIARADAMAQADYEGKEEHFRKLDILSENIKAVLASRDCLTVKSLAIGGNDLKHLGVKEGKAIGTLLNSLLDAVLEDPQQNTKEALTALARHFIKSHQSTGEHI